LAVYGAKYVTADSDRAPVSVQGLPSDGAAAPGAQSAKFALYTKPRARVHRPEREPARQPEHNAQVLPAQKII
jgi:hypothetical protein